MIFRAKSVFSYTLICLLFASAISVKSQESTLISNIANVKVKNHQQVSNEEVRLCWDDSIFYNSVGLTNGGAFTSAIRFDTDTLAFYQSYRIKQIDIYFNESPSAANIKIWQGNSQSNLQEKVSFTYNPQPESWNEITLDNPFTIDNTQELWVGVSYESEAGVKPAGTDTLTNAEGYGNMIKIGDNEWTTLATYHIKGDWNIQVIIEEIVIEGFTVNFNLDMSNATFGDESETFDPRNHKVYISGSMNEWATPGSDDNFEMKLKYNDQEEGEISTTLFESWENYFEFTQDISPWVTLIANDSTDTWQFEGFNFTGEGSPFSFMVFNPDSTKPSIVDSYPAYSGEKYLIAVQSIEPNDDKWLISPQLLGTQTSKLSFFAKSISDVYGAERIQVLISTTNTELASFSIISEGDYIEVPTEWTMFEFDLSEYIDQPYYFAIRYVSEDAQMLMIDDIEVSGEQTIPDEWIYNFTLYHEGFLDYKYYVVKDEPTTDFAEWLETEYRTINILSNRTINDIWGVPTSTNPIDSELSYKVYPNPTSDLIYIESSEIIREIQLVDISGRIVKTFINLNNVNYSVNVNDLNEGVYILSLKTKGKIQNAKIIIKK